MEPCGPDSRHVLLQSNTCNCARTSLRGGDGDCNGWRKAEPKCEGGPWRGNRGGESVDCWVWIFPPDRNRGKAPVPNQSGGATGRRGSLGPNQHGVEGASTTSRRARRISDRGAQCQLARRRAAP